MTSPPIGSTDILNRDTLRIGRFAALALACLSISGCGPGGAPSDGRPSSRIRLVGTTGQVTDMLRNVGGEHVVVEGLMGSGVDPHLYRATPADVRRLNAADVILYNGLHLEGRLADLLERLARRKPVFAVTEGLRRQHSRLLRKVPGATDQYDPHVWFDLSLWARCVDYAAEKLIASDPDHAEDYRRNADAYVARLKDLHELCKQQLAAIPRQRRVLVTAHDAFGYFGDAYDVEVHGLQGISTLDEADLSEANQMVEMLVSRRIKAVFVESSVPAKNVRALVEACASRGHRVVIGGELFSDAMGPEGTPQGTFVGMVRHNLKTIVEALQ